MTRSKALFGPLHADAPDSPKVWALAEALGVPPYAALGLAAALWARGLEVSGVFRMPPRLLAHRLGWDGDAAALVEALMAVRLLVPVDGGWRIHEHEHYGQRCLDVREKAAAKKQQQRQQREGGWVPPASPPGPDSVPGTVSGTSPPLSPGTPLISSLSSCSSLASQEGGQGGGGALADLGLAQTPAGDVVLRGAPRAPRRPTIYEADQRSREPLTLEAALAAPHHAGGTLGAAFAAACPALDGRDGRPSVAQAASEGWWAHWQTQEARGVPRWIWPTQVQAKAMSWMRDANLAALRNRITVEGAIARGVDPTKPVEQAHDPRRRKLAQEHHRLRGEGADLPPLDQWIEDLEHWGRTELALAGSLMADGTGVRTRPPPAGKPRLVRSEEAPEPDGPGMDEQAGLALLRAAGITREIP